MHRNNKIPIDKIYVSKRDCFKIYQYNRYVLKRIYVFIAILIIALITGIEIVLSGHVGSTIHIEGHSVNILLIVGIVFGLSCAGIYSSFKSTI